MIELRALGPARLTGHGGEQVLSVLAQPKRLALLVYLATAEPPGFRRRDELLALFWPETDTDRGRAALRKALHHLRNSVGADALPGRGDEVEVDPDVVWNDVQAFRAAVTEGRGVEALALYRGDFLEGFHADGCAGFERWMDETREQLRRQATEAALAAAESAAEEGNAHEASERAREAAGLSPFDETVHRAALRIMDRVGNEAGALRLHEDFVERLAEELEAAPSPRTEVLVGTIRKAVEVLPAHRVSAASEFAREMTDETFRSPPGDRTPSAPDPRRRWRSKALAATAVATAGVAWAVGVSIGAVRDDPRGPEAFPFRYTVPVDPSGLAHLGHPRYTGWGRPSARALAFSPDGTTLVYEVWYQNDAGELESSIFLRRLDQEDLVSLEVGEDAEQPFFSPDGRWLGFLEGGAIRRRSMTSGQVEVVVADSVNPLAGLGWSDRGEIFYVDGQGRLMRVPQAGGVPVEVEVGTLDHGAEIAHPAPVPGSPLVLFSVIHFPGDVSGEVRAVHPETGESWLVLDDAMDARALRSGHLLFMRHGALMAIRFDESRGRVEGTPVLQIDGVMHALRWPNLDLTLGSGQYVVSDAGHLAYVPGGIFPDRRRSVVRVSREGSVDTLDAEPRAYLHLRASPVGDWLALAAFGSGGRLEIYLHDLQRGVTRHLHTGGVFNGLFSWNPVGSELAYQSFDDKRLYRVPAGGGEPTLLPVETPNSYLQEWAANGDLLYRVSGRGYWALRADGEVAPVLDLPSGAWHGTVSPDGRWLAYSSRATERREVYVRPYSGPGATTLVSRTGGLAPAWSRDGRSLYFRGRADTGQHALLSVDIMPGENLQVSAPYPVVDPWNLTQTYPLRSYDVGPEGFIYAITRDTGERERYAVDAITLVLNFTADLERRFADPAGD